MAVIRDVMPAFDLLQPSSAAEAQQLLEQNGADAWVMAGGLDSFDWLKDRIKKPKVLVDLSGVDELNGIRTTGDGVEIGAMTTLTEIANHPEIQKNYGVLSEAVSAGRVAADSQPRHAGRQRFAGCALLVLPRRMAVLSRGRKHLLCRYAGGAQSRARDLWRRPLRGRASIGLCAGADRAGCEVRGADARRASALWMPKIILSGRRTTLRSSIFCSRAIC